MAPSNRWWCSDREQPSYQKGSMPAKPISIEGLRFQLRTHHRRHHRSRLVVQRHLSENVSKMKAAAEGFSIVKARIAFHGEMAGEVPDFSYAEMRKLNFPRTKTH